MKQLTCTCRVCGNAMEIEFEHNSVIEGNELIKLAVCDRCLDDHDKQTRDRIAKYHRDQERECRKPYSD